jgi:hypothetical protein
MVDQPAPETLEGMAPRVLVISYDPVVDPVQGTRLSQWMKWNDTAGLISGYIADVSACSGGLVSYQVVGQEMADEFPIKQDGFRYTAKSYLELFSQRARPHDPDWVDYHGIVESHHLIDRVQAGEIDEVWLFGFPSSGFYESRMVGKGAFWCNAPPLEGTDRCRRRFVIMGFSYERGVGEMLEDLGHRAESVLNRVFERVPGDANLWKRFTRYDKIAPGRAEVGSIHFAPNSERDYDWGNRRTVLSRCDAWLRFPDLSGEPRRVTCAEWGNGDIRQHHRWWLDHLPKTSGSTAGIANNWWRYFVRVDDTLFD